VKYKVSMDNKGKVTVDKELGKSLTEAPMPRSLEMEIAEKCMGEGKADLLHEMAKYMHEQKQETQKAKFFRRLNKVLDNKLVKPSIIIEYVNQYQRGDK
jgi:uncharacterized protein YaaW (UPF0174 family)